MQQRFPWPLSRIFSLPLKIRYPCRVHDGKSNNGIVFLTATFRRNKRHVSTVSLYLFGFDSVSHCLYITGPRYLTMVWFLLSRALVLFTWPGITLTGLPCPSLFAIARVCPAFQSAIMPCIIISHFEPASTALFAKRSVSLLHDASFQSSERFSRTANSCIRIYEAMFTTKGRLQLIITSQSIATLPCSHYRRHHPTPCIPGRNREKLALGIYCRLTGSADPQPRDPI